MPAALRIAGNAISSATSFFVTEFKLTKLVRVHRALLHLVWSHFRWRLLLPPLWALLALLAQIAALFVVFRYAQVLQHNLAAQFLGFTVMPRESIGLLVATALVGLVLQLLYGLAQYAHKALSQRMATEIEKRIVLESFAAFAGGSVPAIATGARFNRMPDIMRAIFSDPRRVGRALRLTLQMILPAVVVVAGGVLLMSISWVATVALLPVGLVYVWQQSRISRSGIRASHEHEQQTIAVRGQVRERLAANRSFRLGRVEQENEPPEVDASLERHGAMLLAQHQSSLASDIAVAVCLVLVLATLTAQAIFFGGSWEAAVVYLAALRYTWNNLKSLSTRLTIFNRLYPQTQRVFQLREAMAHAAGFDGRPRVVVVCAEAVDYLNLHGHASAVHTGMTAKDLASWAVLDGATEPARVTAVLRRLRREPELRARFEAILAELPAAAGSVSPPADLADDAAWLDWCGFAHNAFRVQLAYYGAGFSTLVINPPARQLISDAQWNALASSVLSRHGLLFVLQDAERTDLPVERFVVFGGAEDAVWQGDRVQFLAELPRLRELVRVAVEQRERSRSAGADDADDDDDGG